MSQTLQPVWERRTNMGASPIAIYTAEEIRELREREGDELQPITHAALIDAAFRRAGVPELHAALLELVELDVARNMHRARAALAACSQNLDITMPRRRHYKDKAP